MPARTTRSTSSSRAHAPRRARAKDGKASTPPPTRSSTAASTTTTRWRWRRCASTSCSRRLRLDPVTIQLLWTRLISVVDEASSGLIRTAYTPSVKEYHDFCCAIFDVQARLLSHSTITTPGLLGVIPDIMVNFVGRHPPETL